MILFTTPWLFGLLALIFDWSNTFVAGAAAAGLYGEILHHWIVKKDKKMKEVSERIMKDTEESADAYKRRNLPDIAHNLFASSAGPDDPKEKAETHSMLLHEKV